MTIKPESFNLPDWLWEALDPGVQAFYVSWEKEQQEIATTNSPDPNKPVVGMEFHRTDDLPHDGSPVVGIDAEGRCYFAVVPAPAFQAQLDRIEMMLHQLMPKQEKKEAPDAGFCIDYLNSVDPGNFLAFTEHNGANDEIVFIVKTRRELAKDHQEWLCAQYAPHNLTFKVGW